MMSRVVVIGLVCVAGVFFISNNTAASNTSQQAEISQETLPATLDQFYPPVNPAPAYLLAMLDLGRLFSATVCDVQENDLQNANVNFEAFRKAYGASSEMVPEWKEWYPTAPIEQLKTAMATGDPTKIMPAVESVGAVCHECHLTFMPAVQQKYRWGKFSDITLVDPLSKKDVSFATLMLMMETNFDGIANDLVQGQHANAIQQFADFQARFQEMAAACVSCHDSERQYYTSGDVAESISALQAELNKPETDPGVVGGLLQTIGQESCSTCHLVHIPAAYSQALRGVRTEAIGH